MIKTILLKKLCDTANELDSLNMTKEANTITNIMVKLSQTQESYIEELPTEDWYIIGETDNGYKVIAKKNNYSDAYDLYSRMQDQTSNGISQYSSVELATQDQLFLFGL